MTDITLSIVIPTYNRAPLLRYLLQSLVAGLADWPPDLEIIVLDNASTDETAEVVGEFTLQKYPIDFRRNASNIGMDANLAACFDAASGEYLWQIGDDEIIYGGVVAYVLRLCRNRSFGVLHLANDGFLQGQQDAVMTRRLPNGVEPEKIDAHDLFRAANIYLTFISASVINRRAVLARLPRFSTSDDPNTYVPQLAWIFSALMALDTHYHINKPLFGALAGNTGGYRLIEVFGVNVVNMTRKYLGDFYPRAANIMMRASITRVVASELYGLSKQQVAGNNFDAEDLGGAINRAFGTDIYSRLFIRPMLGKSHILKSLTWFGLRVFNKLNRQLGYRLL